jgi:hypothetical protein
LQKNQIAAKDFFRKFTHSTKKYWRWNTLGNLQGQKEKKEINPKPTYLL